MAIEYPLVYLIMIRLWSVCKTHGYVTSADFVRARFGSPTLALAVAITGIVATMPYIALNLLGIQAVLLTMGITGSWPLIIAFVVLAAFTYKSGVRAPALISFIKDGLVYLVIAVAIFYIPAKLGGWTHIFDSYNAHFKATPPGTANLLTSANQWQYITLALGSAFAIFLYPHSVTGVLTTRSRAVVKRTMAGLPIYSFILLINPQFSIDLQLLGGAIILQTLPSVMLGLYTRWLHRRALIAGWAAGMTACVWTFYLTPNPDLKEPHWGGTAFALSHLGRSTDVGIYIGFIGVVVNLVVCVAATVLLKAVRARDGVDQTAAADYFTDVADGVPAEPVVTAGGLA